MALSTVLSQKISLRRSPILEVNWRRVYALPTRHGFMVGLAVFGVFAISVRIQHNMLLLLAVALFVIFLISVIWGAYNLHRLKGVVQNPKVLLAGQLSQLTFSIIGRQSCYDLRVKRPDASSKTKAQPASLYMPHEFSYVPMQRGISHAPPFMIETHFPFGLVRVWLWLFLPHVIVAPEPDFKSAHMMLTGRQLQADFENDERGEFNADSLEMWQEGIPLSRISWKQYAAKDRLLYKTGAASGHDMVRLDYKDVQLFDFEAVLRVLCAGLLLAHEASLTVELILDDGVSHRFAPDQQDEALRLLALHEKAAIS